MNQQGEAFQREDYSQASQSDFRWPAIDNFRAQPPQPYQVARNYPSSYDQEALERQRDRRAITWRIVIALFSAMPLTGIVLDAFDGSIMRLAGVLLTWVGITMAVWAASGCPNPFNKN